MSEEKFEIMNVRVNEISQIYDLTQKKRLNEIFTTLRIQTEASFIFIFFLNEF